MEKIEIAEKVYRSIYKACGEKTDVKNVLGGYIDFWEQMNKELPTAQQKEIERLKEELNAAKSNKDYYRKRALDNKRENTQLKKQLKVLEELNDKFKAQRDKAEQKLKV